MNKRFVVLTLVMLALSILSVNLVAAQDDTTLVIWADDTRAPALQPVAEQFTADTGIAVEIVELGFGNIRDRLRVAGPAGEGPDIIIGAHDWLGELVSNNLVAPLDLGEQEANFLPAAVQAFVYDGQLYGMPYALENVAFVRNTDLVPDAPATWDEVRTISETLVSEGRSQYGYVIQTNDPYHFFPLMTSFGGYVFGVTEAGYDAGDVGIDNEGAIAAGEYLQGLGEAGLLPEGTIAYNELHALFNSGDAAMIITGPWAVPLLTEGGQPFEVSAIPSGPAGAGRPFLGVQGFMINAFSENTLLAEEFLLGYVASDDVMQAIFDADPRPSAWLTVREANLEGSIAGFAAAGENGLPMPAIPAMSSVWTAWGNAVQFSIVQDDDVVAADAFPEAATQIRTLIGEGGEVVDTATLTIPEVLELRGNFTTLLAAVGTAGLAETLAGGEFTVLAPTDQAFTDTLTALGMTPEDALADENLANILQYHVIEGRLTIRDIVEAGSVTTLTGDTLTITVTEQGEILINAAETTNDAGETVLAGISFGAVDIEASNGYIHAINAVLIPPSGE